MASNELLASALWYARNGWYVFPCSPGAKEPLIPRTAGGRGLLDATRDEAQIVRWWTNCQNANIGIACEPSALVVVDVDVKNAGDVTLEGLRAEVPRDTFDTMTALTPSGGTHFVYRTDGTETRSGTNVLGQGIDIRAIGGYIVAAPSVVNGKSYTWEVGYGPKDDVLRVWPDALAEKIVKKSAAPVLEAAKSIAPGARNSTLASIAGSMRRRGMDFDEMMGALQVVNYKRCNPPLSYDDLERIAKSIARYEPDAILGTDNLHVDEPLEIAPAKAIFETLHCRYDDTTPAMPFGIRHLDGAIGGLLAGQLTVLGARPGVGKTSFGEHIAEHAAKSGSVLMFSLEMARRRIVERMAARHEGMPVKEYREAGRPFSDLSWWNGLNFELVDKSRKITVEDIAKTVLSRRPNLVIIDHARHIKGWLATDGKMRADLAPAHIMQALTALAEEAGTHIMLLSQLTRSSDNAKPRLSDLRDAGSVEENADNVLMLHRPFQFDYNENDDVLEIYCLKSREGGTFVAHVGWNGRIAQILDCDPTRVENLKYIRCCHSGQVRRGAA